MGDFFGFVFLETVFSAFKGWGGRGVVSFYVMKYSYEMNSSAREALSGVQTGGLHRVVPIHFKLQSDWYSVSKDKQRKYQCSLGRIGAGNSEMCVDFTSRRAALLCTQNYLERLKHPPGTKVSEGRASDTLGGCTRPLVQATTSKKREDKIFTECLLSVRYQENSGKEGSHFLPWRILIWYPLNCCQEVQKQNDKKTWSDMRFLIIYLIINDEHIIF